MAPRTKSRSRSRKTNSRHLTGKENTTVVNRILKTITPEKKARAIRIKKGETNISCGITCGRGRQNTGKKIKLLNGRFQVVKHAKGMTLFVTGDGPFKKDKNGKNTKERGNVWRIISLEGKNKN